MKTYKIHLIRNALTAANLEGRYLGHSDEPLCEQGVAQLEQLISEYTYPDAQVVFCSPLERCKKTAQMIYPGKQLVTMDELIEYDFGEFDGKTAEELETHPVFPDWLAGKEGVDPPFGENSEAFARRICSGFEKIADGMLKSGVDSAAIVTHGGVIMQLMSRYALPEAKAHEWVTPSGCGYTLCITPSVWMTGRKLEAVCEIPEPERDYDYERSLWGQEPLGEDIY